MENNSNNQLTNLKKLPKTFNFTVENNEFTATKAGKNVISGQGNLRYLKYIMYKIEPKESLEDKKDESYKGYDNIKMCFYRIDSNVYNTAKENIIESKVSATSPNRPHVDFKTCNIHPKEEKQEYVVKQLLLCNGLGPKTKPSENENMDVYYSYLNKHYAHKACYYPLIEDNKSETLKKDWRQMFLKEFLNSLVIEINKQLDAEQVLSDELKNTIDKTNGKEQN